MSLIDAMAWEKGQMAGRAMEEPVNPPEVKRKGDWLLTFSGKAYWPLDPRAEEVCIDDIAHALAYQCRYGGHVKRFYSVAEHSVLVSQHVPAEYALVGLMHDATEAYVADVPRPLKPHLKEYSGIEMRNWDSICKAFDLPMTGTVPDEVHDIDSRICIDEMACLMATFPKGHQQDVKGEKLYPRIECLPPVEAEQLFLNRFHQLWSARMAARWPAAVTLRRAA